MKKFVSIIIVSAALFFFTCKKGGCNGGDATVIKDCTGTYLRMSDKDFHVCNPEKLASYSDGQTVTTKHKKISECNGTANDAVVCAMHHPNEGWIEITSVK